jgi:hypothetical protein
MAFMKITVFLFFNGKGGFPELRNRRISVKVWRAEKFRPAAFERKTTAPCAAPPIASEALSFFA